MINFKIKNIKLIITIIGISFLTILLTKFEKNKYNESKIYLSGDLKKSDKLKINTIVATMLQKKLNIDNINSHRTSETSIIYKSNNKIVIDEDYINKNLPITQASKDINKTNTYSFIEKGIKQSNEPIKYCETFYKWFVDFDRTEKTVERILTKKIEKGILELEKKFSTLKFRSICDEINILRKVNKKQPIIIKITNKQVEFYEVGQYKMRSMQLYLLIFMLFIPFLGINIAFRKNKN